MVNRKQKFIWGEGTEKVSVNYDPKSEVVELVFDGVSINVPIADIWSFAFLVSDEEEQEKLIPVTTKEVKVYSKQIKLELKNDMKKGDVVVANVKFTVPIEEYIKKGDPTPN